MTRQEAEETARKKSGPLLAPHSIRNFFANDKIGLAPHVSKRIDAGGHVRKRLYGALTAGDNGASRNTPTHR